MQSIRARFLRAFLFALAVLPQALPAHAADISVLIQLLPGSKYKVWHAEGPTKLSEDELMELEAVATREGSAPVNTSFGPARAYSTPDGVFVKLPQLKTDGTLLLERDVCSAIKAWHEEGAAILSEDELTELVLAAKPDGGKSITLGARKAKAYITQHGVMAVIWTPRARAN